MALRDLLRTSLRTAQQAAPQRRYLDGEQYLAEALLTRAGHNWYIIIAFVQLRENGLVPREIDAEGSHHARIMQAGRLPDVHGPPDMPDQGHRPL
jgi:hypothetical protein